MKAPTMPCNCPKPDFSNGECLVDIGVNKTVNCKQCIRCGGYKEVKK